MQKWVQMGYYWVIGFNPLGFGLGWVIEGGTQNPMGWVLGRRLRPKMGSAEVYIGLLYKGEVNRSRGI